MNENEDLRVKLQSIFGALTALSLGTWSKDNKFAASGSLDTNVFVWSLESPGKRIKVPNAHKDGVNAIVWDEKLFSAGADAAVKQWVVQGLD